MFLKGVEEHQRGTPLLRVVRRQFVQLGLSFDGTEKLIRNPLAVALAHYEVEGTQNRHHVAHENSPAAGRAGISKLQNDGDRIFRR